MRHRRPFPWGFAIAALFIALGVLVCLTASAYSFTGMLFVGFGILLGLYRLLRLLQTRHVTLAKVLRLILSCGVLLVLLAACVTGIRIAWTAAGHPAVNCRYVVVLGAGVDGDVPSMSLRERLDAASAYLAAHPQSICVVSGGQGDGENLTEAACMYRELTARGIAPERVWMEELASSTAENLRFSLDLIEERTGTRPTQIGLVTSEYHLYRAGLMAERLGVSAVGIPGETEMPTLLVNYFLREIVAVWYYSIFGG